MITRLLRPEAEPSEGGMVTFRRQLLMVIGGCAVLGVWFLVPWATVGDNPTIPAVITILSGTFIGILTMVLSRRYPRATSVLLTATSLAWVALVWAAFRRPVSMALLAVPVLAAGLLLGRLGGFVAGASSCALVAVLGSSQSLQGGLYWFLWVLMLSAIALIAGSFAAQVDYWERALVTRQRNYILQLRERQGELNRVLKALDEAYESLKRTNNELADARIRADEARSLKEQFVANVSHELRTPLNLIIGFAEMMYLSPEVYQGVQWTPTLEGDLGEVYRASRHLQSLVNDILDLSRIDASRLPMFRELHDLRPIIHEAAETVMPLFRQRNLDFTVEWPDDLPDLLVDRTRIRQVLLNLFNNAVRYTDKGGVRVTVASTEGEVVVGVHDTGVGIPAEQLGHIFEQFRQADPAPRGRAGAGLGLSLSREFIRLHDGRMWVESVVGQGSSFFFAVPRPGVGVTSSPLRRVPERARRRGESAPVLVIDPDPSIAEMLSRYLGDHPVLTVDEETQLVDAVRALHPAAIVANLPPDAPPDVWAESPEPDIARYGVPVFRCSIPSPSWLHHATTFDEVLTKPVTQESLDRLLRRRAPDGARILVVDDDPGFVRLVRRMLEVSGWAGEVDVAYSGPHALRLAEEHPPTLVLLDLLMPEMDGFEVLRAMRGNPALEGVCTVAVTATSYAEEALQRMGSRLTLIQTTGLTTGTVVEILNAALGHVQPDYTAVEDGETGQQTTPTPSVGYRTEESA